MGLDSLAGHDAGVDAGSSGLHTATLPILKGLTCMLVGVAQLPLAFRVAEITGESAALFVMGSGGWLLIGIGINLFRRRAPFEITWTDSNRAELLQAVFLVVLSVIVVAVALAVSI